MMMVIFILLMRSLFYATYYGACDIICVLYRYAFDFAFICKIVKQVLIEMEPFIEKTIKSAVATAIDAILPQLEKSVLGENERLTKTIGDLHSVIQSQEFDADRLAQYSR